jgi:cytoskeleton protein RodZ
MEEGAAQSHSSSPGARLAEAREQAGMTVLQAAQSLRLDVATLQALEAGRVETLGASVFVRGHLRHYAELLGLPEDEIEAAYAASSAKLAAQPDLRRTSTLPGNAAPRGMSLPPRAALIGAIVLVLVALVWWAMRVPPGRRRGAAAPPPASVQAPEAQSPRAAGGATGGAVDAGPEVPAGNAPAAGARTEAASPKAAVAPLREGTSRDAASRDTVAMVRDVVQGSKPVVAAAAKNSAPVRVRLAIRFNQDSWIEVYDAHGTTLFHDFGGAGLERRVSGTAPLRVLLGNPDGVTVELNGHPVALRPAAESGRPQRFLLDSEGGMSDVPASSAPP